MGKALSNFACVRPADSGVRTQRVLIPLIWDPRVMQSAGTQGQLLPTFPALAQLLLRVLIYLAKLATTKLVTILLALAYNFPSHTRCRITTRLDFRRKELLVVR